MCTKKLQAKLYLPVLVIALLSFTGARSASGQCILMNPSFEILDSGSNVFSGWNQFDIVGYSTTATHGSRAARMTGPNYGGWDVSGYWQQMDTAPGERWSASVKAWHTPVNPLTGSSRAMLNIEWRDSGDNLISFESHTPVDSSTPVDEVQDFYVESGPAPSGTVKARILVAVLQEPGQPPPDVYYDQATFYNLTPPTVDDMQWNDFPGGETVYFSGRTWRVKGPGYYGPGPSSFCDDAGCVWVDGDDDLHMTIQRIGSTWYSTEVVLEEPLGYGDYIFTTVGRLDQLHENTVFGLFVWQYGPCWSEEYLWWNPYNEFDIEFSRWGDPGNSIGQFVAQPYDWPGNISRFDATFADDEITSHAFNWLADRVECRSWRGGPNDESPENIIHSWTYTGPHIPRPEQPRVHLNLWQLNGGPGIYQEVVLDEFTFVPEQTAGIDDEVEDVPVAGASVISMARPNPFGPQTTITYFLKKGGMTEVSVFDVRGRLLRTLEGGYVRAGSHDVVWDGTDDSGKRVAPGVYLYRLRTDDLVETRSIVKLK
jgi:hypothetical protein